MMPKLAKPPGQRLVKRMSTNTKGLIMAPLGLLLLSGGIWVLIQAALVRQTGVPLRQWIFYAGYGFILLNGGLLLFGQAIRYRTQLDYRRFVRREFKKRDRIISRLVQKRKASPKSEA